MKLLIDNALSPRLAALLRSNGYDAVHVTEREAGDASDETILGLASQEDRVIVSADSDFGVILASQQASKPSFILFRESALVTTEDFATRLILWLPLVADSLHRGAIVVFRRDRTRVRSLPL